MLGGGLEYEIGGCEANRDCAVCRDDDGGVDLRGARALLRVLEVDLRLTLEQAGNYRPDVVAGRLVIEATNRSRTMVTVADLNAVLSEIGEPPLDAEEWTPLAA